MAPTSLHWITQDIKFSVLRTEKVHLSPEPSPIAGVPGWHCVTVSSCKFLSWRIIHFKCQSSNITSGTMVKWNYLLTCLPDWIASRIFTFSPRVVKRNIQYVWFVKYQAIPSTRTGLVPSPSDPRIKTSRDKDSPLLSSPLDSLVVFVVRCW